MALFSQRFWMQLSALDAKVVATQRAHQASSSRLLVSYRTDSASLDRAQKLAEQLATSTDATFVNTRGWVRYKRGEYQEALPLLQQAVDKAPDSPVMRYNLGMAQLKTGDKESALRNLEVAVSAAKPFAGINEARAALAEAKRTG